jgi:hypothetical protein
MATITQAVILLSTNTLDRGWFKPLWHACLCFNYGRVKFVSPDVEIGKIDSVTTPLMGSVFVYLCDREERFATGFSWLER